MPNLHPVILCGGSGTRLWPLSREDYPKQFLRLNGQHSLLQQTLQRSAAVSTMPPLLLSQASSRFIVAEQLREAGIGNASILLEPLRRNTGPAIVCAALHLCQQHDDALMLILPADHALQNQQAFAAAVEVAAEAALSGQLMTFGIRPDSAETAYGYLRAEPLPDAEGDGTDINRVIPLAEFVEKPDRATAERFLASGNYYWNSGMFLFRASLLLQEIKRHAPTMLEVCQRAINSADKDLDFIRLDGATYADNPDLAIDYALMERTDCAAMVALDAGWSDIGSWHSVWQNAAKDSDGNAAQGDVVLQNCRNSLVHGAHRLVAAIGLQDISIIDTPDALLVMDRHQAQDTRQLVAALNQAQRSEAGNHRQVSRPWGSYDAIGSGPRFQVKRIIVRPGARLSLQMHHHRAEHWIVVAGTARVTQGKEEFLLTENQSAYIAVGVVHSLENPGKIPLELIEVQSGSYLGEDDIIRLQDRYGRA